MAFFLAFFLWLISTFFCICSHHLALLEIGDNSVNFRAAAWTWAFLDSARQTASLLLMAFGRQVKKKSQGRLKAGLYFLIKSPILFIGTFFIKNNICSVAKKYDVFFFCACILIAHVSCKVELWLAYISKGDKSLNI